MTGCQSKEVNIQITTNDTEQQTANVANTAEEEIAEEQTEDIDNYERSPFKGIEKEEEKIEIFKGLLPDNYNITLKNEEKGWTESIQINKTSALLYCEYYRDSEAALCSKEEASYFTVNNTYIDNISANGGNTYYKSDMEVLDVKEGEIKHFVEYDKDTFPQKYDEDYFIQDIYPIFFISGNQGVSNIRYEEVQSGRYIVVANKNLKQYYELNDENNVVGIKIQTFKGKWSDCEIIFSEREEDIAIPEDYKNYEDKIDTEENGVSITESEFHGYGYDINMALTAATEGCTELVPME